MPGSCQKLSTEQAKIASKEATERALIELGRQQKDAEHAATAEADIMAKAEYVAETYGRQECETEQDMRLRVSECIRRQGVPIDHATECIMCLVGGVKCMKAREKHAATGREATETALSCATANAKRLAAELSSAEERAHDASVALREAEQRGATIALEATWTSRALAATMMTLSFLTAVWPPALTELEIAAHTFHIACLTACAVGTSRTAGSAAAWWKGVTAAHRPGDVASSKRLRRFYQEHNPEKLEDPGFIVRTLRRYQDCDAQLFDRLESAYGVTSEKRREVMAGGKEKGQ